MSRVSFCSFFKVEFGLQGSIQFYWTAYSKQLKYSNNVGRRLMEVCVIYIRLHDNSFAGWYDKNKILITQQNASTLEQINKVYSEKDMLNHIIKV